MIGICIAGLIVAFIVFAVLYSIQEMLKRLTNTVEYNQENETKIKHLEYGLKIHRNMINELLEYISEVENPLTPQGEEMVRQAKYIVSEFKTE